MSYEDVENRFSFHPANDETTRELHDTVRAELKNVALWLDSTLAEGREKSLVLTKLEEAQFWSNASIARP